MRRQTTDHNQLLDALEPEIVEDLDVATGDDVLGGYGMGTSGVSSAPMPS